MEKGEIGFKFKKKSLREQNLLQHMLAFYIQRLQTNR